MKQERLTVQNKQASEKYRHDIVGRGGTKYLGELLNLSICPHAQESQQTQSKSHKEHGLPTHKATGFHYFHSTIVEDTLVQLIVQLIVDTSHQVKSSRLQLQLNVTPSATQKASKQDSKKCTPL